MPEFTDPTLRLRVSFLAAVAEFRADRDYPVPWFVDDVDSQWNRRPIGGSVRVIPHSPSLGAIAMPGLPRWPPAHPAGGYIPAG
jgi:hypothetical protein